LVFQVKSAGDAALARENKLRARRINPTIGVHRQSAGVRMNADSCNGRSYVSGSGDLSMEREFSGGLEGPTLSTPKSQHSSPSRSLSANSIKVELCSDDDPGHALRPQRRGGAEKSEGWKEDRGEKMEDGGPELGGGDGGGYGEGVSPKPASPGPIRLPNGKLKCDVCGMICIGPNVLMVHKRSHTGERPFKCNQCGASFTQKGNLLRHIKLHSGEKPFKCPFCVYACRRRDALTGHLRTHSVSSPIVGKPYKCSYCGRSYKQQSSLEEHRERCHSYLQSLETQSTQGEDLHDLELTLDPLMHPTFNNRLANSLTKRKRTTPQKFVEKHMHLNMADTPYELNPALDKGGDALGSQHQGVDSAHFAGVGGEYLSGPGGPEPHQPLRLPHRVTVTCLSELTPVISSIYGQMGHPGPRADCAGGGAGAGDMVSGFGREAGEGHEDLPPLGHSHAPSPSNGCQDSTDSESVVEEQCAAIVAVSNPDHHHHHHHHHHAPPPPPLLQQHGRDRHSPTHAKERERDEPTPAASLVPPPGSPGSGRAVRVVDGEDQPVQSFRCQHCRILFLDHVMFTIHMGCHGFRQPFECNICGHRSLDRYEFSSHIIRGEHKVD
ncbi:hypothetical protein AAFF_G00011140, partial [Aldrovandia affinis]